MKTLITYFGEATLWLLIFGFYMCAVWTVSDVCNLPEEWVFILAIGAGGLVTVSFRLWLYSINSYIKRKK